MIQFEHPEYFLLLLPIVPLLVYWSRKSYADLSLLRTRTVFVLRFLALACVVTALSRPVLQLENRDRAVLFLVDVSDSVPAEALDETWERIEAQTRDMEGDRKAGLILFARQSHLEIPLQEEPFELTPQLKRRMFHRRERSRLEERKQELERSDLNAEREAELERIDEELQEIAAWRAEIGADGTDLESACRLSRGLLPQEARRRLVLFSDGNDNRGDMLRELDELRGAGFSVHTVPLQPSREKSEVIAERILLPVEAHAKAPFDMELQVSSNKATRARITLYKDKFQLATFERDLKKGRNPIRIPRISLEKGFHEFEAVVTPMDSGDDTILENNVARGAVRVEGKPKVLVIDRNVRDVQHLEEALRKEGIDVVVDPPQGIPDTLNELLGYDVLILSNVPSDTMTLSQMDLIKRYVREMGGGLVMVGGDRSFGLGGYYRTPIEDALPVKMPIKKNVEKPNLALVLVIDKSGSMQGQKIQLAKEAAIASAEVLKPSDQFGLVAFDSLSEWVCPLTDATDLENISSTVARLKASGGTHIYPGLYDAYIALRDTEAKLKHIILMSDGHTTGGGYENLIDHITGDEITLSTVGIGQDADQNLLKMMAERGGGEFYFTNDFDQIPQIFTRETMRASKSMLVEGFFVPRVMTHSAILKGIDLESMPFLAGYVATQRRSQATVSLVSDWGDPILATWNYGLGRSAAFTSSIRSPWADEWISWEGFGKFWAQLIRFVMSTGSHRDLHTKNRVTFKDGKVHLTVDVRGRRGEFRDDIDPEVVVEGKDGERKILQVRHVAPGIYKTDFPLEDYGAFYHLMVLQRRDGQVVHKKALAVTESYSPEFQSPLVDEDLLRLVASSTEGSYAPEPEQVWEFEGEPARTPQDTWWYLIVAALCLLPFDLAVRRIGR